MNECFNCGSEFEGSYCPKCGTKFEKKKKCPNCNFAVDDSVKFCNYCGYAFDTEVTDVPVSSSKEASSVCNSFPVWTFLAKSLPKVSMYALALFSFLLWAFFAAPFATLFDISLGNVYTTLNGVIDDYLIIARTSLAFGVISLVYAIAIIVLSFVSKTANIVVGKFNLVKLLVVCGNMLYVPFFALGCAVIEKSKEIGAENGSYSSVIIAFSVIFAVMSACSLIADSLLRRNNNLYANAVKALDQIKKEREEHKLQIISELKEKATKILAEQGIIKPEAVERPDRKKILMIERFNGGSLRSVFFILLSLSFIFGIGCAILLVITKSNFGNMDMMFFYVFGIPAIIVFLIDMMLGARCLKKQKLYKIVKNRDKQCHIEIFDESLFIKRSKHNKNFLIVCGILGIIFLLPVIVVSFVPKSLVGEYLHNECYLVGGSLSALMLIFICILLFNFVRGRKLKRLFNIVRSNSNYIDVNAENADNTLTLELICKQNYDYDMYCRDLRYFNCNVRRVSTDKPSLDRSQYCSRIKRMKAIVAVCVLVAIVFSTVIGIVVESQNIFKESKILQVRKGMTKDEVIKILGETEFTSNNSWNYYSDNYVKLVRKAEELRKQMENVENIEQAYKIQQQINELQQKMKNTTYKYIIVTFDSDGEVKDVIYDFDFKINNTAAFNFNAAVVFCKTKTTSTVM